LIKTLWGSCDKKEHFVASDVRDWSNHVRQGGNAETLVTRQFRLPYMQFPIQVLIMPKVAELLLRNGNWCNQPGQAIQSCLQLCNDLRCLLKTSSI